MAILSGNTDLLEKAKLEKKVAALESERKSFHKAKSNSIWRLEECTRNFDYNNECISRMTDDYEKFLSRVQTDKDGNRLNTITLIGVDSSDEKTIGKHL